MVPADNNALHTAKRQMAVTNTFALHVNVSPENLLFRTHAEARSLQTSASGTRRFFFSAASSACHSLARAPCYPGPAGDATPGNDLIQSRERARLNISLQVFLRFAAILRGTAAALFALARVTDFLRAGFFSGFAASGAAAAPLCRLAGGFLRGLRRCCVFRCSARLPPLARPRPVSCGRSGVPRSGAAASSSRQIVQRDGLRIRVLGHARVALAVGDVRAVAAVQHLDVVDAEVLDDAVGVRFLLQADDLERALAASTV